MPEFKGPKGTAYVYQGAGHDWVVEWWSKPISRRPGRHVKRTFPNSAKQAAIIVAKQMTGIFKEP